ncbi:Stxbp4 [Acrasis kona]|uniref:Stxbp4 n=1 Tax=Acrasis kona TaxID=1008807 RepID=A0AAW2YMU4_9EUKA
MASEEAFIFDDDPTHHTVSNDEIERKNKIFLEEARKESIPAVVNGQANTIAYFKKIGKILQRLNYHTTSTRSLCDTTSFIEKNEEGEKLDPVAIFRFNQVEIRARQQEGVLGAPIGGDINRNSNAILQHFINNGGDVYKDFKHDDVLSFDTGDQITAAAFSLRDQLPWTARTPAFPNTVGTIVIVSPSTPKLSVNVYEL